MKYPLFVILRAFLLKSRQYGVCFYMRCYHIDNLGVGVLY